MLLDFLNCPRCNKPFEPDWSKSRTPVCDANGFSCKKCAQKQSYRLHFVMLILKQPGLTLTKSGWVAIGPVMTWQCRECKAFVSPTSGHYSRVECLHPVRCGPWPIITGRKFIRFGSCNPKPSCGKTCSQCKDGLKPPEKFQAEADKFMAKYSQLRRIMSAQRNAISDTCTMCLEPFGNGTAIMGAKETFCKKCYDESVVQKTSAGLEARLARHVHEQIATTISQMTSRRDEYADNILTGESAPSNAGKPEKHIEENPSHSHADNAKLVELVEESSALLKRLQAVALSQEKSLAMPD